MHGLFLESRGKELYMVMEKANETLLYASDAGEKFNDRYFEKFMSKSEVILKARQLMQQRFVSCSIYVQNARSIVGTIHTLYPLKPSCYTRLTGPPTNRSREFDVNLHPPFGHNPTLANKFIDKTFGFKPKLLILIVSTKDTEKKPMKEHYMIMEKANETLLYASDAGEKFSDRGKELDMIMDKANETLLYASDAGEKFCDRYFEKFMSKSEVILKARQLMQQRFVSCSIYVQNDRSIVGTIHPPFGHNPTLANKFIDKPFGFKPKLLILIVSTKDTEVYFEDTRNAIFTMFFGVIFGAFCRLEECSSNNCVA
ncbi:Vacuolar fusion protein [Vigna angularis]|uniref:Vacuolar fusion protein n=1 Tax=Phaseolus angularis TaxID=3914 RepID=A0A8T0JSJ9_PHAAN|nr:Vacuolar fusion protein [Vigna angularis]